MNIIFFVHISAIKISFFQMFRSEKTQNANTAKDTAIKPAKLSRGRASKPLLPLGRKWSKKPSPCTTAKSTSLDEEDESVSG